MNTDPELCVAVARAMGKEFSPSFDVQYDWCLVLVTGPLYDQLPRSECPVRPFTPDLPGADFCEALAWAYAKYGQIVFESCGGRTGCALGRSADYGVGATIEQALCRAIVAMG